MSKNSTPINSLNQNFSEKSSDILSNFNVEPTPNSAESMDSNNITPKNRKKLVIIIATLLSLVFLGVVVYLYFMGGLATLGSKGSGGFIIKDPTSKKSTDSLNSGNSASNTSKDLVSPINGVYLSEEAYNQIKSRKPVSAMLNNHPDARPQAGLNAADIIYEIVAEGGISRIMPVFYSKIPNRVGSMRSARIYFMQVAAEYFPIFTHWGVAYRPDYEKNLPKAQFDQLLASGQAETDPRADARSYGDEIALPVANTDTTPDLFYREEGLNVAIEHTGFAKFSNVYTEFKKFYPEPSWSNFQEFKTWKFKEDDSFKVPGTKINKISYNFWDFPNFDSVWTYNPASNSYVRAQGGVKTIDRNDSKEVSIVNFIIQKARETKLGDKKGHLIYDVIGSGDATIYMDGVKIPAKWEKTAARERTNFKDLKGNPIIFNRGLTWVTILPDYSVVTEQ